MIKVSGSIFIAIACLSILISCNEPIETQPLVEKDIVYASIGANPLDQNIEERKYTLMEREIEYLLSIWPGEYDNVEQLSFEKDAGRSSVEIGQHERIHSTATRVHHSHLGEYLIYIEEYKNNDTNNVIRQQIYELLPEDEIASIRIRRYDIDNAQSLWRSETITSDIEKLPKRQISLNESCDILLQREGKEFIGSTIQQDCNLDNSLSSSDFQIKISEERYSFRHKKENTQREDWYVLEKARCFVCMVDFPREPGGRPVNTKYYIDIHDQGGQFDFDYDDGRHMVLTMRNTWSYGMQRNTFVIVIQEGSLEGPTLIYSWGSDGADRIGMNPGWIRIQCDLKTEKNIKLQQKLRPDS